MSQRGEKSKDSPQRTQRKAERKTYHRGTEGTEKGKSRSLDSVPPDGRDFARDDMRGRCGVRQKKSERKGLTGE